MLAAIEPPAVFQNVEMADQVGLRIGMRVFERVTHASLCAHVNDFIYAMRLQSLCERIEVGEVDLEKRELVLEPALEIRNAILLQRDRVIAAQPIDPDDLFPTRQ